MFDMEKAPKESQEGSLKAGLTYLGYICSILLVWRVFVFELVWLIPRQPVTGLFITVFFHRIACLQVPNRFYQFLSPLFDGDATPSLLIVFLMTLICLRSVKPSQRLPRSFVFVLVLTVTAWISRIIAAEINHNEIAADIQWLEKHRSNDSGRWFSLHNHLFNSLFVPDILLPDKSVVYKTLSLEEANTNECEEGWLAIPGDNPDSFETSWNRFETTGNLELDIFFPRDKNIVNPKVILYLHGGGWEKGHRHFISQNYHGGVPHYLLERNIIVSPSYRMSCMNLNGQDILKDVHDAAAYINRHSKELFGMNEVEVVPWGTSAGGTLALLLSYKYATEMSISGVINFYGVTELREEELKDFPLTEYEKIHNDVFVSMSRHICEKRDVITNVTHRDEQCFEDFSPVAHVSKSSVPTLTIHGLHDGLVLVNQAQRLKKALNDHGVTEATITVQGVHDCDVLTSSFCSQVAVSAIDAFLNHLDD